MTSGSWQGDLERRFLLELDAFISLPHMLHFRRRVSAMKETRLRFRTGTQEWHYLMFLFVAEGEAGNSE